jgi:tetratricopeptide (TPR) repeat protein
VNYENDTHGSVPHKTIYEGLEFIFSGWRITADMANNLANVRKHYRSLSNKFGFRVKPPEFLLNRLGYQFMANNEFDKAIEIFLENVALYPDSDNVYDSLGEAYEKSGNLKLAAENYRIAADKGEKVNSRNLAVYKTNLERVRMLLE